MLSHIETLDLAYNQISSLQPLMTLSTLKSLRLTGNPLSIQEINMLCYVLPDCEVIY
jgi:Leucine-rich repeat (LRR) protein